VKRDQEVKAKVTLKVTVTAEERHAAEGEGVSHGLNAAADGRRP
jgi:hypothetical protein